MYRFIRPDFLLVDLREFFFIFRVGGREKKKKALKTEQTVKLVK